MRHQFSLLLRAVALATVTCITVESVALTSSYITAFRYLQQHDPRKGKSLSEMKVFFRPKTLKRGQQINTDAIAKHLTNIGFLRRNGFDPRTFSVTRNKIVINSNQREFPSAIISLANHVIASIQSEGHEVDSIEVEPEPMVTFLRFMPDELAHRTRMRRIVVLPDDVPETLSDAICSSEDHRFYRHNGIDELGMLAGVVKLHGGSTITQQLMKNEVLDDQSGTIVTKVLSRKVKEIPLALAAERLMTKKEIMAAYVSSCYMGHVPNGPDIHGFAAAASEFFGADLKSLTLGQSAVLAGMVNQPAEYVSAARHGDYSLLRSRRTRVLELMHRNLPQKYTEDMIGRANSEPLQFLFASQNEDDQPLDMISKHFQNFAAAQVQQLISNTGDVTNLRVFTSLDSDLQAAAHEAIMDGLATLDPLVSSACRKQGLETARCERVEAALVAIDVQTGEVLSMVGGRSGELNYAIKHRSPGSAIKPFVYLKAIESGTHSGVAFTAATVIDPIHDPVYGPYRPQRNVGTRATARVQLAASYNGGAVVTANDAGISKVRELIYKLTSSRAEELSGMLAIGGAAGSEVSLVDLVAGTAVFPSGGQKIVPTSFTAVFQDDTKLVLPALQREQVIDSGPAYVTTQMLRSVLRPGGTAPNALRLAGLPNDAPIAGKSGSGQVADLTFVGFSPRIVVGVWVGMPNNLPSLRIEDGFSGARSAMPIWAAFMRAVKLYRPELLSGDFARPGNVKVLPIDPVRGCIATVGQDEFFVAGREQNRCQ